MYLKYFQEIELNCLLQGHTHEDVDQIFSTIDKNGSLLIIIRLMILRNLLKIM